MSIQVFGLPVSRGVAIGRAVLVASSRVDVAHYFIDADQVDAEIDRLRDARDAVAAELDGAEARPAGRGAARAVGAARRAPDAAARRDADRRDQAVDPRAPLQRRVGAVGAARGAGAPVRRDGGRVPARAQGRSRAGGRAAAARAGARRATALVRCRRASRRSARLRRRGPAGAGRQRHRAGRHAAVQAQRLHRLRHRRRRHAPRTPRSSRAAWTSRRSSARARRAG